MAQNLEALAGTAYYLSPDLVNGVQAKAFAAAHGMKLELLSPKDLPLPPDANTLIVDRDNLWLDAHGRRRWLAELEANPPRVTTFVHSYDFEEESEAKNVVMTRRLDEALLRCLGMCLSATAEGKGFACGEPKAEDFDYELARIRLGSDGGPLCD